MANQRLLFSAGTLVLSTMMFAPIGWAESPIGQIKNLTGAVRIIRENVERPAQVGDLLERADIVTTGSESSVGITFIDNSRFAMGPNSRIELVQFRFNPTTQDGEFLTDVKRGTLSVITGSIAKSSPDAMKVKTRTFILGTSGTKFLVRIGE